RERRDAAELGLKSIGPHAKDVARRPVGRHIISRAGGQPGEVEGGRAAVRGGGGRSHEVEGRVVDGDLPVEQAEVARIQRNVQSAVAGGGGQPIVIDVGQGRQVGAKRHGSGAVEAQRGGGGGRIVGGRGVVGVGLTRPVDGLDARDVVGRQTGEHRRD